MRLNEKQAKRILDFLTSKIKHAVFTLKLSNAWPFAGVNYVAGSCFGSSFKVSRSDNKEKYVLTDNFTSYKRCLERLLELSKDGYSIEVYANEFFYNSDQCQFVQFLKPFSTLEQLLIESDLSLA